MSPETMTSAPHLLTENDLYLFNEGSHYRIYDKMGAHPFSHEGQDGAIFSVWAPNARSVSVVGGFNGSTGNPPPNCSYQYCAGYGGG